MMEARNRSLSDWLTRIESGQLRLPRFQRFEAWGYREVKDLLETVIAGMPADAHPGDRYHDQDYE